MWQIDIFNQHTKKKVKTIIASKPTLAPLSKLTESAIATKIVMGNISGDMLKQRFGAWLERIL